MAIAMVLVRTVGLGVRAFRLPGGELARQEAREAQGADVQFLGSDRVSCPLSG